MKNAICLLLILCVAFAASAERYKHEDASKRSNKGNQQAGVAANCNPPTAATELNINNIRTLIQSGGDMWWDFSRPRYEIPKGSGKHSLYAGSLWLAGQDVSKQFKVAAQRFRQQGNDYWTGPLSTVDAEIDAATCSVYDRQWETSRAMVAEFVAWYNADEDTRAALFPGYTIPRVILEWPAHGRNFAPYNEDYYLAPFVDADNSGDYNPESGGDYPAYVLTGKSDCSRSIKDIYGDQNIWWVFNDKGNIHSESGGQGIGMEIRAQAFAFASTDDVNNMTFYNYELVNRSTFELTDTYFGQWVDADLGDARDDYVGCDVRRGLGFFYNADENDEDQAGALGYGANPPAIGVDFFQGPFQANDGKDNCLCENDYAAAIEDDGIVYAGQGAGYGDNIPDNERYGMRKFVYFENSGSGATSDPQIATEYYNMLRGIWKDGTPMTYGGSGYAPNDPNAVPAHYMFPGESDPVHWGTDGVDMGEERWTQEGQPQIDRRFVQSSGPFTLAPGAVNNITVGIVWAQATNGGRLKSVELMRRADDKTQALFDNCFEIIDGPDAPDVAAQELDREVILMLSNPASSNNYKEGYEAVDPFQSVPDSIDTDDNDTLDTKLTREERALFATYKFEGYQIFQLADGSVGTSDLQNPDKARLVAQVDVENHIDRLVNYELDPLIEAEVPNLMVSGANEGIRHSFQFTEDAFATGDSRLINHKTYYYMAVAYAYNKHGDGVGNLKHVNGEYDPSDPTKLDGQKKPYLASRKSSTGPVRVIEVIPHRTEVESDGIQANAQYGDGVELTRIEGLGNSRNFVDIKQEEIDSALMANDEWSIPQLTYKAGQGPVEIKVVDPLAIPVGNFQIAFKDNHNGDMEQLEWVLTGDGIEPIYSDQTVMLQNEQVIFELGLSVTSAYAHPARHGRARSNGFIGFDVAYADETDQWLSGISDVDADSRFNWIKSGKTITPILSDPTRKDHTEDDHHTNFEEVQFPTAQNPDVPADTANPIDAEQHWENIAGRTWAPFALASYDTAHPVPMFSLFDAAYVELGELIVRNTNLRNTPSVDIHITSDKSKWTRCPVLEAQDNPLLTEGGAARGELRRALSVDKEGRNQLDPNVNLEEATLGGKQVLDTLVAELRDSDKEYFAEFGFDSDAKLSELSFGMGWFPGYAVDVETGERLNMAFAEDSWLGSENGADMQWNPTQTITEPLYGELRFGGKHMVYVFRNNRENPAFGYNNMMPSYDQGQFAFQRMLAWDPTNPNELTKNNKDRDGFLAVMSSGAWAGYPLVAPNAQLFGASGKNDVTIKLRASRPYQPYAVENKQLNPDIQTGKTYYVFDGALNAQYEREDGLVLQGDLYKGQRFKAAAGTYNRLTDEVWLVETVNDALPLYNFSTHAIAPTKDLDIAVNELDEIKAVPNPYYAYSSYETGRLDTRIKIINLPEECTVNIFTVNGTLVRTFRKDDPTMTSIDWDLKNQDDTPIVGGLYIIHVDAPGIGETVIKWFGVLRPVDLTAF